MNEKSQLPKRDSKYDIILRLIHPDIPTYISFLLIMKLYFTKNLLFFFISYFFRYTGIIIRCANFSITVQQIKLNKTISKIVRNFSSYKLVQLLKMKNQGYINSCYIIFVICIFRHILYLILYLKLKKKKKEENKDMKIKPFKILIFLDHIVFFAYPYILEHLSFVYDIIYLPAKFYIKKTNDCMKTNYILCFINAIFIIIYNFDGFLHIIAINRPYDDKDSPVQYRYSNVKFWVIFLLQNFCTIEALALFITGMVLKVFKFVMIIFFFLLFVILYFCSLHNYNYPNILNKFIEIISGFSFFSLVIEVICCIFNYNILTNTHLIFMTCGKVMVSFLFLFVSDSIAMKFMLNFSKNELFKINKKINNRNVYDVFLFMLKNLRDIYEKEDQTKLQNILTVIYMHKEKCTQENCKCKLIHVSPYGKRYTENYVLYLIQRLTFLIETAFVEIDYTNDYEVTLLLSEDYYIFHKNPIMAYSMIQTLLHLQYKRLSISEILNLYEVSQKYIQYDNELQNQKTRQITINAENNKKKNNNINNNQDIIERNKELELRELFLTLQRIDKIQNYYFEYTSNFLSILKEKYQFNISLKIETYKDNTTEISGINNIYLTNTNIRILLNLLQNEIKNKKQITKLISLLEGANLPISFIYRSFLFYYYFLGGTIENEVIPILYSFTNDHNLYSSKIKYDIFNILLFQFKKCNIMNKSRYEVIFECTKGIHCSYLSSQLAEILNFQYKDLHNLDLESFLPKYLSTPHTNYIMRKLIFRKHRINLDKTAFLFVSNEHAYKTVFHSIVIAGLSKNLTFFESFILVEKPKEYYFLLNQKFESFSLSENFYRDYGISLNFLEKWQISFMDLFGIKLETIQNDFMVYNQKLKDYKMKLNIVPGEYFTKRIFKNNERNFKNERGRYLLDDYLNMNNDNSTNKGISHNDNGKGDEEDDDNGVEDDEKIKLYQGLINVRKKLENIYDDTKLTNNNKLYIKCKESKINFISRLYNIFKELIETDIHDKSYLMLEQIISKYKDFYNLNEVKSERERLTLSKNNFFDITITTSLLYDTPFFIVKIKEINLSATLIKFEKSFKPSIKTTSLITELPKEYINNGESDTNTISASLSPITKINVENPNNIIGYNEKKSSDFLNANCIKLIVMFIYFILVLLVVGYLLIYIYQKKTIDISKSLFLSLFYNYYQRDDFFHLYTFYLSLYFYYMNLTNIGSIYNKVTLYDFQNILDQKSINLENCYHNFYTYYIDFNQRTGYSIDGIFDEFLVKKLSVNWVAGQYKSDYLTEIEYLSYKTKVFKLPKNISDDFEEYSSLLYSSKEMLLGTYKTLPDNTKVNSTFIIILYYITSNGNNFNQLFELLNEKIEESYLKYNKKSRKIYTLLEITSFIVSLIFFFLCFYYLSIYNKIIFTKIIKLFINENIISIFKYNEVAKSENFFLIKIIREFHSLLIDFNITNITKFNEALKIKLPSEILINQDLKEIYNDKDDNKSIVSFRKKRKISENNNDTKETKENNQEILENDKSQKTSVIENLLSRNTSQSKISISSSNLINVQNPPIGSIGSLNLGIKNKKILKYNNEYLENNNMIKKGKNVQFKNKNSIDNKGNKNNGDKDNPMLNDIQITLENLISKLDYSTIYQIKILYIFLGIFFFGFVIYIIIKLIESLKIYSNITKHFNDFQIVMNQYTYIYNFYNNILTAIILPDFSNSTLLNQILKIKEEQSLQFSDLMNNRVKNYKYFNKLYSEIVNSFNENDLTKHHLLICNLNGKNEEEKNNNMCYKIISSEYSLFDKGLNIGIDAMFQEMSDIYNDYSAAKTIIKNEQDINKYFTSSKFLKLYMNTNFIINKLQDVFYNGFLREQSSLSSSMNKTVLLLNLICFILCVILIFFIFVFADREVKGLYQMITESSCRILISFRHIKSKNEKFK